MSALPQSPEQLFEALAAIFPEFHNYDRGESDEAALTYHSVLMDFCCYFGMEKDSFSEKQLRKFGELVSAAVAQAGPLENAFETCFLEHLHQIKAERVLRPYLSNLAR